MDLDQALGEFDAVETNLRRLELVWERLQALTPQGIAFFGDSPEGVEYENANRGFADLVAGLPAIDGWSISAFPFPLDGIAQGRLDAADVGDNEFALSVEQMISAPGQDIREYRFRFNRHRQRLVRQRVRLLIDEIAQRLADLAGRIERDTKPIDDPEWPLLVDSIREVERLIGSSVGRKGRWGYLHRHISFAQGGDLHDIFEHDWPSVLEDIEAGLYGEYEPVPVSMADLADIAAAHPAGAVTTKLAWEALDADDFERLIYNVLKDANGYENLRWLTKTNAPDRGRDLSVDRVLTDALSGVSRQRVIVQCKHWLSKSIGVADVAATLAAMSLWEPPPVDVLILATSGRFSSDAVAWIELHNEKRERPRIDPWPETHLESLLVQQPHVVQAFGLRGSRSKPA